MKENARVDIVSGIILLIIAIYGLYISLQLPPPSVNDVGAGMFPTGIAIGLSLLSAFLIVNGFRKRTRTEGEDSVSQKGNMLKIVILTLAIIFYVILFLNTNFILSSILFLIVGQIIFGVKNKLIMVLVSVLVPLALFLIFTKILLVPLS